ncbi:MAG: family 10 glycosylhydrolase [Chitinophagaceae bacterium]
MKLQKSLSLYIFFSFCFLLSKAQNPKFEFRAVWIASVENIDWPSKRGLPVDSQKAEFIRLLDMFQKNGLNAVIMQIRPAADAFYPSSLEPWSEYLTGVQGMPPSPYYDPLKFMIDETHKRSMEFHAWCNPYRAVFSVGKSSIAPNHITHIQKNWFLTYGGGTEGYKKYFDPGNPEARIFVTDVVKDIVTRYDVDAIHFDDYFYPYPIAGKEFPDGESFRKHGNGLSKAEWRRSNCDSIILSISKTIKSIKPNVKFGISPFGIWRNLKNDADGSATNGLSNYDDLYADILLWQKMGWIDYVLPQCYWEFGHKLADYEVLVDWWAGHSYGKHVYIGHGWYRAGSNAAWKDKNQLPNQIKLLREYGNIQGSALYNAKTFYRNPNGWNDSLRNHYYNTIALVPPMKWIDSIPPPNPFITKKGNTILVRRGIKSERLRSYVVYAFTPGKPDGDNAANIVKLFEGADELILDEKFLAQYPGKLIGVSALDWNNNESGVVIAK